MKTDDETDELYPEWEGLDIFLPGATDFITFEEFVCMLEDGRVQPAPQPAGEHRPAHVAATEDEDRIHCVCSCLK